MKMPINQALFTIWYVKPQKISSFLTMFVWNSRAAYQFLYATLWHISIVPGHVAGSEKELHAMVHEVNHTQVEAEEVLSENVYHYDRKKHCLSICWTQISIPPLQVCGALSGEWTLYITGFPAVLNKIEEISHKNLTFSKRCGMIASLLSRKREDPGRSTMYAGKELA